MVKSAGQIDEHVVEVQVHVFKHRMERVVNGGNVFGQAVAVRVGNGRQIAIFVGYFVADFDVRVVQVPNARS